MFKRWLSRIAISSLAKELVLDIDTVQRKDGNVYARVRIEAFGKVLLDRYIDVPDNTSIDIRIGKGESL